jgi:hypothetical protein
VETLAPNAPPAWLLAARKKAALNERWFKDAKGWPQKNNWHHVQWFELAEKHDKLLIEAAREHSKTQIFAVTQPLVEMALDQNVRILLISDVDEKSQDRCRVLREHITSNERFKADCPEVELVRKDGDRRFWIRRDRYWLKEAAVTSTYAGGPIAGGRFDIIIPDDLVAYLINANTPGKRQKISRWWNDDVLNSLAPGGKVWAIGTHQHHDDLYEEIKRDPAFHFEVYPAVDEEDTGYGHLGYAENNARRGNVRGEDALCLWPQAFGYAQHMAKKDNPSTHDSYLRQQQQLAVPETGLVYRKPLMDAALERGKAVAYDPEAAQYLGIDPGYSIRAAMLCIQERGGDKIELWAEHSFTHMLPEDVAARVIEHAKTYGLEAVFIDAEDPGWAAKIRKERDAHGLAFKVVGVPFGQFKRHAIKTTRWLLGSGLVAWKAESTTVHTPGRVRVQPSIFRREVTAYALKDGTDDEPMKEDDHGPDAWTAYASKWVRHWIKATRQEAA